MDGNSGGGGVGQLRHAAAITLRPIKAEPLSMTVDGPSMPGWLKA